MKKAIYPGSFDPVTNGHLDIIERGSRMADELTVAIGINPDKRPVFTLHERKALLQQATAHLPNVTVEVFRGLLVQFAYKSGIPWVIRGVRDGADMQTEALLATINERQQKGIETVLLPTRNEKSHISSSAAKELQKHYGEVAEYVPVPVKAALEARVSGQYFAGITGESGVGKSHLAQQLAAEAGRSHVDLHSIDLDQIGHEILESLIDGGYRSVRDRIRTLFGDNIARADGTIDRRLLGPIVFEDPAKLQVLNEVMRTPLLARLRDIVAFKQGIMLVDGAILAESDMTYLVNHQMILADADDDVQRERLRNRDSHRTDEQIKRRLESQLTAEKKAALVNVAQQRDRHGTLLQFDTTRYEDADVRRLLEELLSTIDTFGELRIRRIARRLQVPHDAAFYADLHHSYEGDSRPYHNMHHLLDGLAFLERHAKHLSNVDAVLWAWLHHDYVYDARAKDNEEHSVDIAVQRAQTLGKDPEFLEDVKRLILLTQHRNPPAQEDEKLLIDADLAILGKSPDEFDAYERAVRSEYEHVSDRDWREGRRKVLEYFLAKGDGLYTTDVMRATAGVQALANLRRSIEKLK